MMNVLGVLWGFFVLTTINALLLHNAAIGIVTLVGVLFTLGKALRPRMGEGVLMAVCGIGILGTAMYYALPVTTPGLLGILAAACIATTLVSRKEKKVPVSFSLPRIDIGLVVLSIVGLLAWWSATLPLSVEESVRTPWAVVPMLVVLGLGMSVLATVTLVMRGRSIGAWLLAANVFSAITLAVFLYPNGYGFDPFLHRATIAHIAEHGTITPKPLYYIGEYALELFAIKLFALPLFWVDVLLTPILLTLVILTAFTSRHRLNPLVLLLLPLGAFVSTTPQSLAYVFTFATILFGWQRLAHNAERWPMYITAVAALAIHPLAGIPAAMFVVMTEASAIKKIVARRTVFVLGTTLAAIILPLVFIVQAKLAGLNVGFSLSNALDLSRLPLDGYLSNHFNTWFDGLYLVISNLFWIVLILGTIGAFIARRTMKNWYVPALLALALIINFIILSLAFDFSYLISYERTDFALRLLTLTQLVLLPYVAVALAHATFALKHKPPLLKLSLAALLGAVFAASVYGAYPRHDNYARSAGFNVTQTDIDAVHVIAGHEGSADYIVLSNQNVAAAAVQEFGFRKYYHGDIFYYPIPTGGPLYQIYLKMVGESPTRATAEEAMDLAGVNTAYLVINDYWWNADQIIENAKREADEWSVLGNGQVTIFRFAR